jgi:hypothetical protein
MKLANAAALTAAILVGVLAVTPADARGGRGRVGVGVYIGGPVWGPAWYPRPYYYYPFAYGYPYPAYTYPYGYPYPAPASPPVYIERDEAAPAPAPQSQSQSQNWYYCPGAKAYYPYVRECPGGWQQVPAQPSAR